MTTFELIQGGNTTPRPVRKARPWCPVNQPVPTEPQGYTATGTPIWLKRAPITATGRANRRSGKFMYWPPSLETVFEDGVTFLFSFAQEIGKPWDVERIRQWARDAYTRKTGEPAPAVRSERILVSGDKPGERIEVEAIAPADAPKAPPAPSRPKKAPSRAATAPSSPAPTKVAKPRRKAAATPWEGKTFFYRSHRTGRLHGFGA